MNDISLTIEILTPVNVKYYDKNNLYIESEPFDKIIAHKSYLIEKYFKKSSFSNRIECLEEAQGRIKLLLASIQNKRKSKMSTTMKAQKNKSLDQNSSDERKS